MANVRFPVEIVIRWALRLAHGLAESQFSLCDFRQICEGSKIVLRFWRRGGAQYILSIRKYPPEQGVHKLTPLVKL